jgi:glycosyltransferase involved in cell wall biosynthesis
MPNDQPRLSIGLPVFNGEKYLAEAIDSILGQTFSDFELIICDNASTDNTQDICQAYSERDGRIRYFRNQENIGAVQNWYRTFELSLSEYFTAAAHDDFYHPEFMLKCVEVLDQNPAVVLCYARTKIIDENGKYVQDFVVEIDTNSPKPNVRLYNTINVDYLCIQLYGVIRADALRRTQVYIGYYGCDRNTLAELSLLGRIYEIPEYLFYHRLHPQALGAAQNSGRSIQELLALDPGTDWRSQSPTITRFRNYFTAVSRVPLSGPERLLCYWQLVRSIGAKSTSRLQRRTRPVQA